MPISRVRRPRIWKSPAPCGDADAKEQEARHENPHAPEDEQDHTKIVFAKANVIHNVRISIVELASEVTRGQTPPPPPGEP
jgi:hypothetical protein